MFHTDCFRYRRRRIVFAVAGLRGGDCYGDVLIGAVLQREDISGYGRYFGIA